MINIERLLENLRENGWHITAFPFYYNRKEYIVLFEDLKNIDEKEECYIVRLTFLDREDIHRVLELDANVYRFDIGVTEFRAFFEVGGIGNLSDFFRRFYMFFNSIIPQVCNQNFDEVTKREVVKKLNRHDNDNAMCCYSVRRNGVHNGVQYYRSIFNDNKTRILRKSLYDRLGEDKTISFCYRENGEVDDISIYLQLMKNDDDR